MEPGLETEADYTIARRRMIAEQLLSRGINDRNILNAFLSVPRHQFVDVAVRSRAYDDCSFPIGYKQTISQPYIIAFMLHALGVTHKDRVLEVGTGSGYQTAILSHLAREIFSIERISSLSKKAEEVLKRIPTGKIRLKTGDGSTGWNCYSPFDRIVVSASMNNRPTKLIEQLSDKGTLIAPITSDAERLVLFRRVGERIVERQLSMCSFVPMRKGVG